MTTKQCWTRDMSKLNEQLAPFVIDGDLIDTRRAPRHVLDTYSRLCQYGYANGFVA